MRGKARGASNLFPDGGTSSVESLLAVSENAVASLPGDEAGFKKMHCNIAKWVVVCLLCLLLHVAPI